MEIQDRNHLHFIQAIKGGFFTKVLNVTRGRPTLSFKEVTDIYDSFVSCNDVVKAERSCSVIMEERTVKIESGAFGCSANDVDDYSSFDLDDNSFESITLKQIKQRCKTMKRKHSQGIDSYKRKVKIEVSLSQEDYIRRQMEADNSDLMETLSNWKSKLSKNVKTKKRKCIKDPLSTYGQEIIPVFKSEDIEIGQECAASSCADSVALVEVKSEVPETSCLDHQMKLSSARYDSSDCHGPNNYSGIVAEEEAAIMHECVSGNKLNYVQKEHADLIPLQMVGSSSTVILLSNSELTRDPSPNFPAMEFESKECTIHPDVDYISPKAISLVEDHNSDIYDNQPDGESPVFLPTVATHEGLDCVDQGYSDDGTFLISCGKDEFKSDADVQAKTCSVSEHGLNTSGYLVCSLDDSHGFEEKQSFSSTCDDEERHEMEATDKLTSGNEHSSSNLRCPKRLLSNRMTISPSSQERLCKAMQSIDIHDKDFLKSRGKLYFGEPTNRNSTAEGYNEITRARYVDNHNKICISSKPSSKGFHPKGILRIPCPSSPAPRLSTGSSNLRSCSKSAIAFSKQQMHDVECLAMRLTKELKSMKDIVDDMLRSEFCLNTSLRSKVNKATLAVRNASRTEENAKRCLSIMARNCSRFCKLMKLVDDGSAPQHVAADNGSAPQDVVCKHNKKIAFADEAGGKLCQVRFYEDEGGSLL